MRSRFDQLLCREQRKETGQRRKINLSELGLNGLMLIIGLTTSIVSGGNFSLQAQIFDSD